MKGRRRRIEGGKKKKAEREREGEAGKERPAARSAILGVVLLEATLKKKPTSKRSIVTAGGKNA